MSALSQTGSVIAEPMASTLRDREPRHYMRTSSRNPQVVSPFLCEHPIGVARAAPQWAPLTGQRPVNKRNYFSPSFWVESVEKGEHSRTASYLDYTIAQDFHQFWKTECDKERHWQLDVQRRNRMKSEMEHAQMTASLERSRSAPAFWLAKKRPKMSVWRP